LNTYWGKSPLVLNLGNTPHCNVCGNKYRLMVKISCKNGVVLIRFIGTHKEYDAINVEEV